MADAKELLTSVESTVMWAYLHQLLKSVLEYDPDRPEMCREDALKLCDELLDAKVYSVVYGRVAVIEWENREVRLNARQILRRYNFFPLAKLGSVEPNERLWLMRRDAGIRLAFYFHQAVI